METHSIPQRLLLAAGLLTLAACSDSTAPTRGTTQGAVRVTATTTGTDLPSGGYNVSVDSGAGQAVAANGAVTISGLNAGSHSVALVAIAANCVAGSANPRSVDVFAGGTSDVSFAVACMTTALAGEIAFTSDRDGTEQIYVMNADGSKPTRLTNGPANNRRPAWSPDGARIAFASDRDGNDEIYVTNADGSGLVRLTSDPAEDYDPAWSPDGTKIAFTSRRDGGAPEIYVMNVDGSSLTRLTYNPLYLEDGEAAWSPDGTRIAFVQGDGETDVGFWHDIAVTNTDGTGSHPIVSGRLYDLSGAAPAWSPDGTRIAFAGVSVVKVSVMSADGTGLHTIDDGLLDYARLTPAWSPNGAKIAFATVCGSCNSYELDIYVVNADGSGVVRLTDHAGRNYSPAWRH